jgi:hypothetical protein
MEHVNKAFHFEYKYFMSEYPQWAMEHVDKYLENLAVVI